MIIKNKQNEKLVGILNNYSKDLLVIICHGFAGNKKNPWLISISEELSKNNISNFRFDFSGNGESEGEFEDSTYHKEVEDLKIVMNYFETQGIKKFILIGHSMGGGVVKIAAQDKRVKGIVSLAGVSFGKQFEERHQKLVDKINKNGVAYFNYKLFGKKFPITKKYLESVKTINIIENAKKIICPVLLIHGSNDHVVPVEESQEYFEALNSKKDFVIINGADHAFNYRYDNNKVPEMVSAIINWIKTIIK